MAKVRRTKRRGPAAPKVCYFCKEKKVPSLHDVSILQKFLTERGKIIPRLRNGLCSKHQRKLGQEIKYARHLALLPFVAGA